MDVHSKEVRSYNMSRVKSKNTKLEEIVRKYLFSKGLRYRKNVRTLPGCPDILLPKYKAAVFVNGCFWHVHEGHPCFKWPKSNTIFWQKKLNLNQIRDADNYKKLSVMGWKVIIVWQCELKKKCFENRMNQLMYEIKGNQKD
ncbi:very short patch repair endonuclease [Pelotomaculum sp. PtaB.Bin117]|uniref:very short patch repair endonuclease n=1 Tax=Pelotomaculum sp. PtaB.Bin117 TaxID=1811694 RepID=UPI0009D3D179|nr:very short patch repair endonuclease [Pelotomaculum sp. PtaB.Bin117]OPX88154.1 MAG: Very short patch repair protein [Pelotomaculum sp. PtaB.Bin117]